MQRSNENLNVLNKILEKQIFLSINKNRKIISYSAIITWLKNFIVKI